MKKKVHFVVSFLLEGDGDYKKAVKETRKEIRELVNGELCTYGVYGETPHGEMTAGNSCSVTLLKKRKA